MGYENKGKNTFIAPVLRVVPSYLQGCCVVILGILHGGSASVEFLGE